jgi:flavin reductase (DIM6/NTAB) family NADH-FMN oxidoreductase RutF
MKKTKPEPAVDAAQFRQVMGKFATGVTIVTAAHGGAYAGFTANAFASVSLEPPLVMVCIGTHNATLEPIQASGAFCVNILSAAQEPLARAFATNGPAKYGYFTNTPIHLAGTGAPIFDEALAWIDCRLVEAHPAGDHLILLGEVVGLSAQPGNPLLYLHSHYTRLPE